MNKWLYMDDCFLKEWDAEVKSVKDGKFAVLDKTAFYPNSGGVQWDTGTMTRVSDGKEFKVTFAGKFGTDISHQVEPENELKEGDRVHCNLDWDRRYLFMRYHTAAHIVSGVFHNIYGAKITGNQITPEKARIDFALDTFDRQTIDAAIDKSNELVSQDLPIKIYTLSREQAEKDETLFKLAVGFKHEITEIRIVEIVGFDRQADGGCHVKSLKDVGEIKFLKADNKGKKNRRVYFKLVD